jgi:hypothetical protein
MIKRQKSTAVIGVLILFFVFESEAWTNTTMHHALTEVSIDLDENGIPDSLESYLADSGVTLPDPYDPGGSDLDGDGISDFGEWVMGTDPLVEESQTFSGGMQTGTNSGGGMVILMQLPAWFGQYAEVFARNDLCSGSWQPVNCWIPTYGEPELQWEDVLRTNDFTFFYRVSDATWDWDGDGRSDDYEHFISQTDPEFFNDVDTDSDGLHDWWEEKLFGDLTQNGFGDFDGDLLLNGEELVWMSASNIVLYSDPTLYDSDADTLSDYAETVTYQTDPMERDTDQDGQDDGEELLGAIPTDPLNADTVAPTISFSM